MRRETTKAEGVATTSTANESLFPKKEEGGDFGPPAGNNRIEVQICGSRNGRMLRMLRTPTRCLSIPIFKPNFPFLPPYFISNFTSNFSLLLSLLKFILSTNSSRHEFLEFLFLFSYYSARNRLILFKAFNLGSANYSSSRNTDIFDTRLIFDKSSTDSGRGYKKIPYPKFAFLEYRSKQVESQLVTIERDSSTIIHNRSIHFS